MEEKIRDKPEHMWPYGAKETRKRQGQVYRMQILTDSQQPKLEHQNNTAQQPE